MTDTSDTKALEQPSDAKDRRLSVFESVDGERKPLGIVVFHRRPDSNWELRYRGVAEAPEKLMQVLHSFTRNRKEAGAVPFSAFVPSLSELASALHAQGFVTEEIPAADHQVSFRIDMDTGGVIGTGSALHAQAGDSASIQRQIIESVSRSFKDAGPQLASELKPLLDSNDQPAAVQALKAAVDKGLFSFCRAPELLDQLLRLDVSHAIDEDRRLVAECRVILSTRLHRYEDLEDDAEFLLASTPGADNTEKGIALQTVKALASIQRGHFETGLSSLQALIAMPSGMSAEGRAWTWRNIAMTLQEPDRNRDGALQAAELSADAFLEAGDKVEAGRSLAIVANLLMSIDPPKAVPVLDQMVGLCDSTEPLDRNKRAAALHFRAHRLLTLDMNERARQDAEEAVSLLRGLLGAEEQMVSSMHLAALVAREMGDDAAADAMENEADLTSEQFKLPRFLLARRLEKLTGSFDAAEAQAIRQEAEAQQDQELVWSILLIEARSNPSLTDQQRLEAFEKILADMAEERAHEAIRNPARVSIGEILARQGQLDRAEQWFRQVLSDNPFDETALGPLVDCLWKQQKWVKAASFLESQIAVKGMLPGILLALGKSQLRAGDFAGSIKSLQKFIDEPGFPEEGKEEARKLQAEVIRSLQGPIPPEPPAPTAAPVTRQEFLTALQDFRVTITGEQRMKFWRRDEDGGHKWVSSPEGLAQTLLGVHLKARFGERIQLFEETPSGAGYVDLYSILEGGLTVVVELKMCGAPYSATGAASGNEQISHYMDNRKSNIGFLVVMDGRSRDNGIPLPKSVPGRHTIEELLVDVRPEVKPQKK